MREQQCGSQGVGENRSRDRGGDPFAGAGHLAERGDVVDRVADRAKRFETEQGLAVHLSGLPYIRVRTTATEGMVGVFYDSDSAGLDGTAIAGGIRPRGGNIDVTWNVANVPDGEYFIYAVLEGAGGTASAYSAGAVTVARARRCGCSTGGQDGVPAGAAVLAVFSCAWFKVRSARARRAPGA